MAKTTGIIDAEVFRQDVSVSPVELQRNFIEHSGLFAHYAAQQVEAMRTEGRMKISMEITEAKAAKGIRDAFAADTEKEKGAKLTEAMIDQGVTRTPEVVTARLAYINAKANTQLAQLAVEAFRQRRDMLIQLGASAREELKGDIRTRLPGAHAGHQASDALRAHMTQS